MSFDPDRERILRGPSIEGVNSWWGNTLNSTPVPNTDSLTGNVSIITMHSPSGGMTYEQLEPYEGNWHQSTSGKAIPYQERYS